jgi:hypothetical protein
VKRRKGERETRIRQLAETKFREAEKGDKELRDEVPRSGKKRKSFRVKQIR